MALVQLATDNFTRGSYPESPLGKTGFSDAGNWSAITWGGNVSLQSVTPGVCEAAAAGNAQMYWSGSVSWSNDQYSEVTVGSGTTGFAGPGVRLGATQGYIVSGISGGAATFYKLQLGGYTSLGNFGTVTFTTGDVLRLTVIGSTFTYYKNGVQQGSTISDTSFPSGFPGVYANGSPVTAMTYTLWAGGGNNDIVGNCGVGGATISWTGTGSGSTTADAFGNYDTGVLANGSYTVTPTATGFTFSPPNANETLTGGGAIANFSSSGGSAFVQGNHVENQSGTSVPIAFSGANTAGNLLVIAVRGGPDTPILITDTNRNNWVLVDSIAGSLSVSFWYASNCVGGANTVTVQFPTSESNIYLAIAEYSGVVTTNPLDAHSIVSGGSSNAPTATAITVNTNELVIGYSGDQAGETYTEGTNYT